MKYFTINKMRGQAGDRFGRKEVLKTGSIHHSRPLTFFTHLNLISFSWTIQVRAREPKKKETFY